MCRRSVRLAIEEAVQRAIPVPGGRWSDDRHRHPEFLALFGGAKLRIFERMEMRIVAFNDDEQGVHSAVAEIFAHVMLGTPYNDFSPS